MMVILEEKVCFCSQKIEDHDGERARDAFWGDQAFPFGAKKSDE